MLNDEHFERLVTRRVEERFQQLQNFHPDPYTTAWIRQQFAELAKQVRGATYATNRALADYADTCEMLHALQERIVSLETDRQADRAKIGELQARVERMADFLNKERKNGEHA